MQETFRRESDSGASDVNADRRRFRRAATARKEEMFGGGQNLAAEDGQKNGSVMPSARKPKNSAWAGLGLFFLFQHMLCV